MQQPVVEIIEKFETLKQNSLEDAVAYLSGDVSIVGTLRQCLRSQISPKSFIQPIFEWLYKCVHQGRVSSELFNFVVQFVPDVVLVYMHAVYENQAQLKASAEVLLLAIVLETEKQRPHSSRVPSLSKPSIYHQTPTQISQSVLTEAALQRHDQSEAPPPRHTFTGKEVTVNNRLLFLSAVIDIYVDSLTVCVPESRAAFCDVCIRIAMQGMCESCLKHLTLDASLGIGVDELGALKRFSVSDPLIVSLLRGIRICIFQSCQDIAVQALEAVKIRAQYELLTVSMQVSSVLTSIVKNVHPVEVQLDVDKHSSYHDEGAPTSIVDPQEVHSSLNSYILHHNLSSESSSASMSQQSQTDLQQQQSRVTSV